MGLLLSSSSTTMMGLRWRAPTRVFGGGECALGWGDRWQRLPLPWASSLLVGGSSSGSLPGSCLLLASTTFPPPLLSSFPPLLSLLTSSFPFPSFGHASIGYVTRRSRSREVGDGAGVVAVPIGTTQLHCGGGATPVGVAPRGF